MKRLKNLFKQLSGIAAKFAIIFVIFTIIACGSTGDISKQDRQKFIDIYVDLTLAYYHAEGDPAHFQTLAAAVYQKYDVDKAYLLKIQKKFENNPQIQLSVYKEIVDKLKGFEGTSTDSLKQIIDKAIDTR